MLRDIIIWIVAVVRYYTAVSRLTVIWSIHEYGVSSTWHRPITSKLRK